MQSVPSNQKIIFFTSPIGLGHASRDIAIAERLKQNLNDEILFVSGGSAHDLISRAKFSVLNLYKPPAFSVKSGTLRNSFVWLLKYMMYYNKSKQIAEAVISKSVHGKPVIVSDEDFACLANRKTTLPKKVLIYDILEPSVSAMTGKTSHYHIIGNKNNLGETRFTSGFLNLFEKKMNKQIRHLINKCDKVIIPDFGENKDNLEYVGPIVREIKANRTTVRNNLGLTRKTVVVCAGGTDAGTYLIQRSLQAYEKLRSRFDLDLIIISGPEIKLNDSSRFRNLGFVDNLHEYIYASDLVISLAGRSTMDESLVYGTPGIFIPIRDHFEQEQNAIRMGFKFEDIFRLETLMEEKLGSTRQDLLHKSNGAEITAKIISGML